MKRDTPFFSACKLSVFIFVLQLLSKPYSQAMFFKNQPKEA